MNVDFSRFDNSFYDPGGSRLKRVAWFLVGSPLVRSTILPFSRFRRALLEWFGARIGEGAVIKPGVRVKYPWNLRAGRNCWIGEDCWIDNLARVSLGDNVCLSQDVYLCTGNHDWSDAAFRLTVHPITIGSGAWIAARAALGPGAQIGEGAVIALGSVVMGRVPDYEIHGGNPAVFLKRRRIGEPRRSENAGVLR